MNRFLTFLALLLISLPLRVTAQDATWFRDVTTAMKLDSARSGQISATDIDNDGYPDLLLLNISYNRSMKTRLYMNRQHPDSANPKARIFVDVTDQSNMYENRDTSVKGRVADCWGMADLNNDGFTDLYITRFGPNILLRNQGDGTFQRVELEAGVADPRWGASAAFFDADEDGDLDLYVCNYAQWTWENNPYCGDKTRGIRMHCGPK
ncbi:MAG: FG-GAP repeat domain-containing protein, partial [Candidatus Kapaibacterium sp.]